MFKRRTREEKKKQKERIEKCIYGMHLDKEQDKWVDENNASNDKFASFLLTTPRTKDRAINGQVTNENMKVFAERLGKSYEEMKTVNFKSMIEFLKYRFGEKEQRKSILLAVSTIILMFITVFTNNLGPALLTIIVAALALHNVKNLWNITIKLDKKDKSIRFIDGAAVVSGVILFVGICSF